MDECSLLSIPTACSRWALNGKQPKNTHLTSKRKRITIFGAVDLRSGEQTSIFIDRGDSKSMIKFIDIIAEKYAGKEVELILDNVSFHKSKEVLNHIETLENIRLCYLPPYAPDLNPQEWIFKDFRKTVTHNHRYKVFESLVKASEKFFCAIKQPNLLNYVVVYDTM